MLGASISNFLPVRVLDFKNWALSLFLFTHFAERISTEAGYLDRRAIGADAAFPDVRGEYLHLDDRSKRRIFRSSTLQIRQ